MEGIRMPAAGPRRKPCARAPSHYIEEASQWLTEIHVLQAERTTLTTLCAVGRMIRLRSRGGSGGNSGLL
jgi:hypothetical protein